MSTGSKRIQKTQTSKRFCQEKYACTGLKTEASFTCEECKTVQCSACDARLHSFAKFLHHERRRLEPPPESLLCQMSCEDRNYADVHCVECEVNYCFSCDSKIHVQGRRKSHKRQSYKEFLAARAKEKRNEELEQAMKEFSPELDERVSKLSPLDLDLSLTNPFETAADFNETVIQNQPQPSTSRSNKTESCVSNADHDCMDYSSDLKFVTLYDQDRMSTHSTSSGQTSLPDITNCTNSSLSEDAYAACHSFMLVDDQEELQVENEENFLEKLGAEAGLVYKVVSIFGNTGDGKSHTLNHTFFGGKEVFKTSPSQSSCTVGVWAALDPVHNAIVIDTEGLLGVTGNQNQRTRLLLKVLAISDVIIYRTRADRLHNDLFHFLGDASKAYVKHFANELKEASKRRNLDVPLSTLGPAVIIFHETTHTDILCEGRDTSPAHKTPTQVLKDRFQALKIAVDAFSSLHYCGTRTIHPPTDFSQLLHATKDQLKNMTVRSPRTPQVVLNALQVLNTKFSGEIEESVPQMFPDQYFTCTSRCLSCGCRCTRTMNHFKDDLSHEADLHMRCKYQHQYDNKVYICKKCFNAGREEIVVPKSYSAQDNSWFGLAKYAWSGYVLECKRCGIIYRSRQHWLGNKEPEDAAVRPEIRHVWPGGPTVLQGTHNAARKLLEGVGYVSGAVTSVSAKPTRFISSWMADQIAPPYWVPNSEIFECFKCKEMFTPTDTKHHCRACGHGFCDDCSTKRRAVPERGWGEALVRVCDDCYEKNVDDTDDIQVTARKVTEAVGSTVGVLASAIDYPMEFLKESARPAYWVADELIKNCCVCKSEFGPKLRIHHCRSCGEGVCDECSPALRRVPSRGWDEPVRVCKNCDKNKDEL
ncbi:zinc finger FYVE domain-containing protein 1-like isoform X2 [Tubulanus polymorphus]|uniref:zinc finger FYVE domain-containing protein 1-like isoform X2 n=1 Tax=Tubulanus polymorphus TaxID=672921 RepID=UPI003DA4898F